MDSSKRIVERFLKDKDGPRTFGAVGSTTRRKAISQLDLPSDSTEASKNSTGFSRDPNPFREFVDFDQSTISSPSSTTGSLLSRRNTSSSTSTAPELGPREDPLDQGLAAMNRLHINEPVYACPFDFTGCRALLEPHDFDNWYSHSLSHFGRRRLPTYTRCIFCPETFENENPNICWRQRMIHIADHLDDGYTINDHARPDFALIRHLYSEGIITPRLYESLQEGNERPRLDGIRPYNYIPESMRQKQRMQEESENRIIIKEPRRSRHERYSKNSAGKRRSAR